MSEPLLPVRFKVGRTYQTRSICDHDCIFEAKVVARTAKTVTADVAGRGIKRFRPFIYDGKECFRPFGTYSMAPTIYANKEKG